MKATEKGFTGFAKTVAALAVAGALSFGMAAPAIAVAEEGQPDQQPVVTTDDGATEESGWDATADEGGFAGDASAYLGDASDEAQNNGGDENGVGWWYRRVSPWQALQATEDFFGVWNYNDWDYQVGRFRGIPAYRVVMDVNDWQPSYGLWCSTARYVAFVNYFTGRVIAGYVDYE